jgi:hypothetical protein
MISMRIGFVWLSSSRLRSVDVVAARHRCRETRGIGRGGFAFLRTEAWGSDRQLSSMNYNFPVGKEAMQNLGEICLWLKLSEQQKTVPVDRLGCRSTQPKRSCM